VTPRAHGGAAPGVAAGVGAVVVLTDRLEDIARKLPNGGLAVEAHDRIAPVLASIATSLGR
jgi:hypothetical protein